MYGYEERSGSIELFEMGGMCVGVRRKERGRRGKGMSPECVTFQPSAGYCVYLFLSPAEMRSEVMAAVVCYLCYNKGMSGRRMTHILNQQHRFM